MQRIVALHISCALSLLKRIPKAAVSDTTNAELSSAACHKKIPAVKKSRLIFATHQNQL
jgi:hypothetical protein